MLFPLLPRLAIFALMSFAGAGVACASFHIMQIEQVVGGVAGDTSAQAIQLRMRSGGENLVSGARLVVVDANGSNPIVVKDMTSNVANGVAGDRVLIVSANFTTHISPAIVPDFIMTQTIPASYLAAGRLLYEDDFGTIYWSVSWGGASYTGSQTGSTINDANGNFGPAFNGVLPSSDLKALQFTGAAAAASTSNLADYSATSGAATFVNNARQSTTVVFKSRISSFGREGNNFRINWNLFPGKTNALQRSVGSPTNFADIFVLTNPSISSTNFLDIGAVTNSSPGFYRARVAP